MDTLCKKYVEEEIRFNEEQRKRILEESRMENTSSENLPVEGNSPQSVQSTIVVDTSAANQATTTTNVTTNQQTERTESPTIAGPSRPY
jgi:hypothetical protein